MSSEMLAVRVQGRARKHPIVDTLADRDPDLHIIMQLRNVVEKNGEENTVHFMADDVEIAPAEAVEALYRYETLEKPYQKEAFMLRLAVSSESFREAIA